MSLLTLGVWIVGVYAAIVAAINFLPVYTDYPLPPEIFTAIQSIFSAALAWNDVFPFSTLIYAVSIYVGFEFLIWVWKGIRWFIAFIRGSGQG